VGLETGETAGGTATSKKQAEQRAAAALLARLGLNGEHDAQA
jgi:dsRNA-specific ribonuclease